MNAIRRADLQLGKPVEDVEFGQRKRVEAIDPDRVSHRHGVVPAAPPRTSGHCTEFLSALAQPVPEFSRQLGWQRSFADAGRVGLRHTQDAVDGPRRNAEAGADAADRGIRRGHVRIGAVIDVKQSCLSAFD